MSSFISLVHKEWIQFRVFIATTLLVCFAINIGIPISVQAITEKTIEFQEIVFMLTIFGTIFLFVAACYQLIRSLTLDVRQKELWLHNPASIYTLIGSKLCFTFGWAVSTTFVYTITLHFLKPLITEGLKIVFLQFIFCIFVFFMLLLISTLLLLGFAFHKYIQRYVKGFAWIFSASFVVVVLVAVGEISELKALESVKVSLDFTANLTPKISSKNISIDGTGLGDIYMLSDLFIWVFIILGFIFASRWIEKVITR